MAAERPTQLRATGTQPDRHVDAARQCQIGAATHRPAWHKCQLVPRPGLVNRPGQQLPPREACHAPSPGQREAAGRLEPHHEREQRNLDSGRVLRIVKQQVGGGQGHAVHCARGADAKSQAPEPAAVLHRRQSRRGQDFYHRSTDCAWNRMKSPGASRAGGERSGSKKQVAV